MSQLIDGKIYHGAMYGDGPGSVEGVTNPPVPHNPNLIAALYVEKGGCYWDLPGVDAWDAARDARLYPGPYPVIAHPPCERWGRFADGGMGRKLLLSVTYE